MKLIESITNAAKSSWNGTTINADTGVVEQTPRSVSHVRPNSFAVQMFTLLYLFGFSFAAATYCVLAQTDMNTAITTVSGYWTTIYPIGIAIVVFVVGRKIVKKL